MIEKTETERISKINLARSKGLLNEEIFNMVENFTNQYGFAKSSFVDGVANPGTKSAKSLVSKLDRKTNVERDFSFTLAETWDIVRCSIIVDNYEQVVPLIKELQKSIPGLQGEVSENDTGYKGVHLSFTIDGFRTEMQVSTREAWFVKQAGEEVYAKWRDFNLDAEINKILEAETSQEAETLREQLVDTLELKQVHNQACREIFEKLHQSSDFAKWKNAINAILAINDNYQNEQLPQEVIDKFSVKSDDSISREELFEKCREFSDLAKPAQEKLISIATNALETAKNMNHVNPNELLTYEEKTFILLKQEYMKILISQSNDKYGDRFIVNNHIRTINRMSNERSLATIEYCREKGIRINSYEVLNSVLKSVNNCDVEKITDLTIKGVENLHKRIEYDIVQNNKTKEISSKKIA